MTDTATPDPQTLDLAAVLAGRSYPESEVEIYLDEAAGYAVGRMNIELQRLANLQQVEAYTVLEEEFRGLLKALEDQKYTFHLRGVPRKVRLDITKKIVAEFPEERDFMGRPKENLERDEAYSQLMWQAHIQKIVAPTGAELVAPDEDNIKQFRDLAPMPAIETIEAGINELTEGSKAGFEIAARSADFLSKPSHEG